MNLYHWIQVTLHLISMAMCMDIVMKFYMHSAIRQFNTNIGLVAVFITLMGTSMLFVVDSISSALGICLHCYMDAQTPLIVTFMHFSYMVGVTIIWLILRRKIHF